jgi:TrmH family RNA methyltransferase
VEPQGLGAVVRQQWTPLSGLRPVPGGLWLAVESIDSPGNLGTIIRTAEASGVAGIIILGDGADPYEPAAVRATMGALFALRLVRCPVWEFIDWARASGVAIVGSSPGGLMDFRSFHCRWPAVLVIGSAKRGLSEQVMESCDLMVRIPMLGRGDSINAAVAAGVLLYELFDQRRTGENQA